MDFLNMNDHQLRQVAGEAGIDPNLLAVLAEEASNRTFAKLSAAQQAEEANYVRRADIYEKVSHLVDIISQAAIAEELHAHGVDPSDHFAKTSGVYLGDSGLAALLEEAELAKVVLSEALAEGADAEESLAEILLEAAAEDPELAAELISAVEDTDVSPEDVDGAAGTLAEEEMDPDAGATKESQARQDFLLKLSHGLSDFSQAVIEARAGRIIEYWQSQG